MAPVTGSHFILTITADLLLFYIIFWITPFCHGMVKVDTSLIADTLPHTLMCILMFFFILFSICSAALSLISTIVYFLPKINRYFGYKKRDEDAILAKTGKRLRPLIRKLFFLFSSCAEEVSTWSKVVKLVKLVKLLRQHPRVQVHTLRSTLVISFGCFLVSFLFYSTGKSDFMDLQKYCTSTVDLVRKIFLVDLNWSSVLQLLYVANRMLLNPSSTIDMTNLTSISLSDLNFKEDLLVFFVVLAPLLFLIFSCLFFFDKFELSVSFWKKIGYNTSPDQIPFSFYKVIERISCSDSSFFNNTWLYWNMVLDRRLDPSFIELRRYLELYYFNGLDVLNPRRAWDYFYPYIDYILSLYSYYSSYLTPPVVFVIIYFTVIFIIVKLVFRYLFYSWDYRSNNVEKNVLLRNSANGKSFFFIWTSVIFVMRLDQILILAATLAHAITVLAGWVSVTYSLWPEQDILVFVIKSICLLISSLFSDLFMLESSVFIFYTVLLFLVIELRVFLRDKNSGDRASFVHTGKAFFFDTRTHGRILFDEWTSRIVVAVLLLAPSAFHIIYCFLGLKKITFFGLMVYFFYCLVALFSFWFVGLWLSVFLSSLAKLFPWVKGSQPLSCSAWFYWSVLRILSFNLVTALSMRYEKYKLSYDESSALQLYYIVRRFVVTIMSATIVIIIIYSLMRLSSCIYLDGCYSIKDNNLREGCFYSDYYFKPFIISYLYFIFRLFFTLVAYHGIIIAPLLALGVAFLIFSFLALLLLIDLVFFISVHCFYTMIEFFVLIKVVSFNGARLRSFGLTLNLIIPKHLSKASKHNPSPTVRVDEKKNIKSCRRIKGLSNLRISSNNYKRKTHITILKKKRTSIKHK